MKPDKKGFSLIELMIVIAIIGILAAIAVPSYKNYVIRAKIATLYMALNGLKPALAEPYIENGQFPDSITFPFGTLNANDLVDTTAFGNYVKQVTYNHSTTSSGAEGGWISLILNGNIDPSLDGTYITLTSSGTSATGLDFKCSYVYLPDASFVPSSCVEWISWFANS